MAGEVATPLPSPGRQSSALGSRASGAGRRVPTWPSIVAALILVSLAAAMLAARISLGSDQWLWNLDLPKIDYPLASFYHEALMAGRLPLWNDRLGLGFPLYAEGQIGAFYPPNWLLFQLPPLAALDATRVFHLTLAGVGAGLLTIRVFGKRGRTPASLLPGGLVAALVAVLGGAITAKLEWHNLVAAYAWIPWILLPLMRRPAPTRAGLVVSGVLFGLQATAGHPNTWLLTGIALTAILVARPPRLRGLARAVGVGVLGACVGAVQLIPTALLTTLSVRSTALTAQDLFAAAATPFDPMGLGFQGAFARITDGSWNIYTAWYPDGIFALYEAAAYVGLPVLALAAIGVGIRSARPILVTIGVLIAIPVLEALQPGFLLAIPFVNGLRSPVRAYLLATLLIGVLAGGAIGRPVSDRATRRAMLLVATPIAVYAIALSLAVLQPSTFDTLVLAFTTFGSAEQVAANRSLAIDALASPWPSLLELGAGLAMLGLLAAAARRPWVTRRPMMLVAPVVVAIPLVLFGPAPNGTRDAGALSYADSAFMQALAAARPHRFVAIDAPGYYVGMPDQPAAAGIADLRMFSSLDLRASDEITERAAHDSADAAALRRALGVDVVVTFDAPCPGRTVATVVDPVATICRDDAVLNPPYWIPASLVTVGAGAGTPIEPREADIDPALVPAHAVPTAVTDRRSTSLTAMVDAPAAGWVWVDRAWWPGWLTAVDGNGVQTVRALGGTLVPVPAGRHTISMSLLPLDALTGLALGMVALLVAGLWTSAGSSVRLRRFRRA